MYILWRGFNFGGCLPKETSNSKSMELGWRFNLCNLRSSAFSTYEEALLTIFRHQIPISIKSLFLKKKKTLKLQIFI